MSSHHAAAGFNQKRTHTFSCRYNWDTARCASVGRQIEAELIEKCIPDEDHESFAIDAIVKGIQAQKLLDHNKNRAMKKVGMMLRGNAEEALKIELYARWSSTAASELEATYDRYLRKYQQAMLCAKKYQWPASKCVAVGKQIEQQIEADKTPPEDQAAVAIDVVVKGIQAQKLLDHNKNRAMKKVGMMLRGNAEEALKIELYARWSSTAASELEATYEDFKKKFQKAMLTGVKYKWNRSKCCAMGAQIEADLAAKGVAPKDAPAAALDFVVAQIKSEKAAAIKAIKEDLTK